MAGVESLSPAHTAPRRVALVIGQLSRGGAEGQLALIARALDPQRVVPIVYCLSEQITPVGEELIAQGIPVRIITGNPLMRAYRLARAFDADQIDLVHSWLFLANAVAGLAHILRPKRPLITAARNCKLQGRYANAWAFFCSRAILVNSGEVSTYIQQHYWAPADRIHITYNGIDTTRFQLAQHTTAPDGPIVTIGRLVEQKNHSLFLRAAAQLVRSGVERQWILVGDGPLRATLEAQAADLGISDHITFAGERRDVETILHGAALFWLTSEWEGMPNVVLEAMASGVPVIATDVSGVAELIRPGVDGYIVPRQDPEAIVQRSRELLLDPERWQQCRQAARSRAEGFSTTQALATLSDLYDEVARGK